MLGELYMLTPITSPMATRPASPDDTAAALFKPPSTLGYAADSETVIPAAAQRPPAIGSAGLTSDSTDHLAAAQASSPKRPMRTATLMVPEVTSNGQGLASASSMTANQHITVDPVPQAACPWTLLSSAVGAAISKVRSASNSPKAQGSQQITFSADTSSPAGLAALLPEHAQQQAHRKPLAVCTGCETAIADGSSCSSCSMKYCKSCMSPASAVEPGGNLLGKSGLEGSCTNCRTLCNACKPIPCSFCGERDGREGPGNHRGQHSVTRMCEACADTCDSCKRASCKACAASFVSCSSCGYASCEDCRLQAQVSAGGSSTSGVTGGCWCAPPLRTASNVRHVSSQRYQMSQLHPSMLASSMEAVGLRDADFDDYDNFDADEKYDDGDHDQDHLNWNDAENSVGMAASQLGVRGGVFPGTQVSSPNGSAVQGSWLNTLMSHSPASSYSSGCHALHGKYGSYGSSAVAAVIAGGMSVGSHQGRQSRSGVIAAKQGGMKGPAPPIGMVF